jgi:apolipoprotein N-acyltransferase
MNKVDLVVWPENSSDIDPIRNSTAHQEIEGLIKEVKTPLLVGAVEETSYGPSNSSLLFDTNGELSSRYVKQELAPFGEYIPLRPLAEAISTDAKKVNNFVVGKEWTLHRIQGIPFASLICFEIVDDDLVRGAIANGATFLVAQTNNATFGRSAEADQQLQITQARAAELGREIVVVSTTGHTAAINRSGRIVKGIPQFDSGVLLTQVHPEYGRTVASKVGSGAWFAGLAIVIALLLRRSIFSR